MISANKKREFPVLQMSCASCAVNVENTLKRTPGIKNASVNYANQSAQIEWDSSHIDITGLRNAVRAAGYDLLIDDPSQSTVEANKLKTYEELKIRTRWAGIFTLPVVALSMFFMDLPYSNFLCMLLSAPVVFYFGRYFFINAFKKLRHRSVSMDTLVALSTGIAFLFSVFNTFFPEFWTNKGLHPHVYYEASAVIIVFISLGKLLEEKAKSTTTAAIKKLMGLQSKTAFVLREGLEKEIPLREIKINDLLIVKPGEKIAVDGLVTEGVSFVDESMFNGEPLALEKVKGHFVYAGSINQKGSFRFRAQKIGNDTWLSQIIEAVQNAQGSKAPVQKLVDRVAEIFVPLVIVIAFATLLLWWALGGENGFTLGLLNSITVLVIACPCALGLATPTAIMVGVGKAAENQILIKDAGSLEIGHKVNTLILDKTGTITEGKPEVNDLVWASGKDSAALRNILLSLEAQSEHPLAEAVVNILKKEGSVHLAVEKFQSLTGKGVQAEIKGEQYYVGNRELMLQLLIKGDPSLAAMEIEFEKQAKTLVYFSDSKKMLALITFSDRLKPHSASAIAQLQRRGIVVYMLSGDNETVCKKVAEQVGITEYRSEMRPSQKAQFVKSLQEKGNVVAMVGDGINDSEALAQAHMSIAMGKGTDIAMDVAGITLTTSDLRSIPKAFTLSQQIVRGIRQNLFWAFIYNVIGIPVAAGVLYPFNGFLLNPMIAAAAMALSSVSVVSNSLRLKRLKL